MWNQDQLYFERLEDASVSVKVYPAPDPEGEQGDELPRPIFDAVLSSSAWDELVAAMGA